MMFIVWPFRILYTTYAFICFVAIMLFIFPFVLIATFFGKIRGGNMIIRLLRFWSGAWFLLVGIRHSNIYRYRPDPSLQYIFVHNHISYLDAAIAVETLRQPFRALGKIEMKDFPVFGIIYRVFVVMVDRKNPENRARSIMELKSVLSQGISIMIFPEGTFNETSAPLKSFYDGAFRIAIETQTPILPVLFLDAYQRMHYRHMFTLNPGRSRSLFLEPVPVAGMTLTDVGALKEKVFRIMEENLMEHSSRA